MTETKAYKIVYALNEMISKGVDFPALVKAAEKLCKKAGDSYSVPSILATSNAPKFHSSVINTWNGGEGGRRHKFTSEGTDVAGYNECFVWLQKNTSFSFSEATENQGFEIEYSDNPRVCHCGVRNCEDDHNTECDDGHWPDYNTIAAADSNDGIVDIVCEKCGASGSALIEANDIQW